MSNQTILKHLKIWRIWLGCLLFTICGIEVAKSEAGNFIHDVLYGSKPENVFAGNNGRAKLGLRLVNTNWVFRGFKADTVYWSKTVDGPICKIASCNANQAPLEDIDYYYSGATYTNEFGKGWEYLAVMYNYTNAFLDVRYVGTNAEIKSVIEPYQYHNTNHLGALSAADFVLKKWELNRLE